MGGPGYPSTPSGGVYDVAVIGGGLVGAAVAYGMRGLTDRVAVLDEGDVAFRASRGNFGLVWVQSKGMGMSAYSRWTQASARLWPDLAADLLALTGIDVHLEQPGGLHPLLSDDEAEARIDYMERLMAQPGMIHFPWKLLDRSEVLQRVPYVGPQVQGAIWTPLDGIVNPLKLLRALHATFSLSGVDYLAGHSASGITRRNGVFVIETPHASLRAAKVVLAAGLGNQALGQLVGLTVPMRPQRGQIMVLERTRRILESPFLTLRQTDEGTWLIGDSQEEAGYADQVVGLPVLSALADRAVRILPALRDVRVVRSWSALRVLSRDGFPVYDQSDSQPGAYVATCHSGVTLAAAHALKLAPMIAAGNLTADMSDFSTRRFHVQEA